MKTITTHNGSTANRDHNIRNPKTTNVQGHIDKSLSYMNEIIVDEKPRDAYKRLFGAALDEYNAKQERPERIIKDYYNHICDDAKKHPVYEMIVQVGDRNDTGTNAPTERAIIKEFIAGWPKRNPSLELIGAYIHADESNGTLHAHLDYIPVAHNYKKGLSVQNGLVKALGQQGFLTAKYGKETAQIRWERRENEVLEKICNAYGIEVHHPLEDKKHLSTSDFIAKQKTLEDVQKQAEKIAVELRNAQEGINVLRAQEDVLRGKLEGLQGEIARHEELLSQAREVGRKYAEELQIVREVLKKEAVAGVAAVGGIDELKLRIAEERQKATDKVKYTLLKRFADQPTVKPLWEQFSQASMLEQSRKFDRGSR